MGYETTLLIGKSRDAGYYDKEQDEITDEFYWFQVYAHIDIRKSEFSMENPKGHAMYFMDFHDGNCQITEDKYGEHLYAYPIKDVLEKLKRLNDKSLCIIWAISLLESMVETTGEELHIITYGH